MRAGNVYGRGVSPVQLDDGVDNWVEKRVDVGFRIAVSPQDAADCQTPVSVATDYMRIACVSSQIWYAEITA